MSGTHRRYERPGLHLYMKEGDSFITGNGVRVTIDKTSRGSVRLTVQTDPWASVQRENKKSDQVKEDPDSVGNQ